MSHSTGETAGVDGGEKWNDGKGEPVGLERNGDGGVGGLNSICSNLFALLFNLCLLLLAD